MKKYMHVSQSIKNMTAFQKAIFWLAVMVFSAAIALALTLQQIVPLCRSIYVVALSGMLLMSFLCVFTVQSVPALPFVHTFLRGELGSRTTFPYTGTLCLAIYYCLLVITSNFMETDNITQWNQVMLRQFTDWHPATHTFLIWLTTLPYRSYVFFLIVQAISFALCFGELWRTLVNFLHLKRNVAGLIVAFLALSPTFIYFLCVGWKDVAMMLFFLIICIMILKILATQGAWLKQWHHVITLGIALALGTLMRHNAFFYTVPLLLSLPFIIAKQFRPHLLATTAIFLVIVLLMKAIVIPHVCVDYQATRTETQANPNQKFRESLGVPLGIMAHIYCTSDHNNLPEDFSRFMGKLASEKEWETLYQVGKGTGLNKIKYGSNTFISTLNATSPKEFVNLFFSIISKYPGKTIFALVKNGIWVWEPFSWPGCWVYVLCFVSILSFPYLKWKVIPLVIPTLAYNAGTTLLLYGQDYRFFAFVLVTCLPYSLGLIISCNQLVHEKP